MRLAALCLLVLAAPAWSETPAEFAGNWSVLMPEVVGKPEPRNQLWKLECANECTLSAPVSPKPLRYQPIPPLNDSLLQQARFALKYARERSANAIEQEPWLAPLLESQAEIAACIDLVDSLEDPPGLMILCRLDRNPWQEPVVLFMGTILANCGPAFCRYGMLPMFRQK